MTSMLCEEGSVLVVSIYVCIFLHNYWS